MDPKMELIRKLVESRMNSSSQTHNFSHVGRVFNLCLDIADFETGVDYNVLKLAALLHDLARAREDADNSGKSDHALMGAQEAKRILEKVGYPKEVVEKVCLCIAQHRFRSENEPASLEARILFDADKLDSLGAIGIARSLYWAGEHKSKLYSSENKEDYSKINIENEEEGGRIMAKDMHASNLEYLMKLKNIPQRLFTRRAKEIARERMAYMDEFYKKFEKEYKGFA